MHDEISSRWILNILRLTAIKFDTVKQTEQMIQSQRTEKQN